MLVTMCLARAPLGTPARKLPSVYGPYSAASRFVVIRQLVVETLLLFVLACGLSLLVQTWLTDLLGQIRGQIPLQFSMDQTADLRVVLVTIGIVLMAGLVSGIVPALRMTKTDVNVSLNEESSSATYRRPHFAKCVGDWTNRDVAAAAHRKAACSFVLLTQAASIDPGFNPKTFRCFH